MSAFRIDQVVVFCKGEYFGQPCKVIAEEEKRELLNKATGRRHMIECTPVRMEDGRKCWVPTYHLAPLAPPMRRAPVPGDWRACDWRPAHMR